MAIKSNLDLGSVDPVREEEFRLPSAGIPYLDAQPDFPETVRVQPYGFKTESILTSHRMWTEKMAAIVKEVVTNFPAGWDPKNLIVGDLFYILAAARGLTYGESYKFETTCPSCSHNEGHEFQVPAELPVHNWFREETLKGKELKAGEQNSPENVEKRGGSVMTADFLTVSLPRIKDDIELKFLNLLDDEQLSAKNRQLEKLGADMGDTVQIARIARHIKSVNGGEPDNIGEAEEYVGKIVGQDMVALADAIRDKAPGINFNGHIVCEKCGHRYPFNLPLPADFFRRNRV